MPLANYPANLQDVMSGNSLFAADAAMKQAEAAQVNDRLNQASALQELFQKEQTNPIEVQQNQANLANTLAQRLGFEADSRSRNVAANKAEATQDSDIQTALSKNKKSLSDDQISMLHNFGQQFASLGAYIKGGGSIMQIADKVPPQVLEWIKQPGNADKAIQSGNRLATQLADHVRAKDLLQMKLDAEKQIAAGHDAATLRAADRRAQPKTAKTPADIILGSKNAEEFRTKAAAIKSMIDPNENPEEYAKWDKVEKNAAGVYAYVQDQKNRGKSTLDLVETANTGKPVSTPTPRDPALPPGVTVGKDGRIKID